MFWVISIYFNIRNTLPKSGTFLLGHLYTLFGVVQGEAHHRWKKSPRLNWTTQFLKVPYDGACSPPVFLSEWLEFPLAPCLARKKKLNDTSRLDVVEIARVA